MSFRSYISLLIQCLVVLSVAERGILKYPIIIVDLSISSFSSDSFCFIYLEAILFVAYIFRIVNVFLVI